MDRRPRQTWTEDPGLRETQDAARAAEAARLARQLRPLGPVGQTLRRSGALRHSEITIVDPTDEALTLTLPRATQGLAGAPVTVVNWSTSTAAITLQAEGGDTIDGATTLSIGGLTYSSTLLICLGAGRWKVAAIV